MLSLGRLPRDIGGVVGIRRRGGPSLHPATLAHIARVQADGGVVDDAQMLDAIIRKLAAEGLWAHTRCLAGPRVGVKKRISGPDTFIAAMYDASPWGGDFAQPTESLQPSVSSDGVYLFYAVGRRMPGSTRARQAVTSAPGVGMWLSYTGTLATGGRVFAYEFPSATSIRVGIGAQSVGIRAAADTVDSGSNNFTATIAFADHSVACATVGGGVVQIWQNGSPGPTVSVADQAFPATDASAVTFGDRSNGGQHVNGFLGFCLTVAVQPTAGQVAAISEVLRSFLPPP
jgi:hypothetical protein